MDNKRLSFEVEADQIDIKPILKKDFLELKIRAISTANPNRNGSWFTKESMEKSKDSFRNKPILGYFENGDFVSHNGEWEEDPETGMDYWDTLGKKGERILGLIREQDEVKIVEDSQGLFWTCCSCALWTQYSYKQVKRLLQDAKRAKKTGESTKNVSVEVDITDYEYLENGVMKINEFNLVGITILGSRNGVKVEPGIENAELSVVDIMGKELYEKQVQGVRLAYERLDGSERNKEEFSQVIDENVATESTVENTTVTEGDNVLAPNPDTVTQPVDNPVENHAENTETPSDTQTDPANQEGDTVSTNFSNDETNSSSNPEQPENNPENTGDAQRQVNSCDCNGDETPRDPVVDVSWLINTAHWNIEEINSSIQYYDSHDVAGKDYILPVLRRLKAMQEAAQAELAGLLAKLAEGYTDDDVHYAEALAEHCDCKELYKENCELKSKCEQLEADQKDLNAKCEQLEAHNNENVAKLNAYAHAEFLKEADTFLKSAKVNEEDYNKFYAECKENAITSLEDLKIKVAVKMFDAQTKIDETNALDTPIAPIDTKSAFSDKAEKVAKSSDHWANLAEYTGRD